MSPDTKFIFDFGDTVRVYREESRLLEGPFKIERLEKQGVWVSDGNMVNTFNLTAVITAAVTVNDEELN